MDRIKLLPDFLIDELSADARLLGITQEEESAVADFLKYRRDNLQNIVQSHQEEFQSLVQWSLFT